MTNYENIIKVLSPKNAFSKLEKRPVIMKLFAVKE